MPSASVLGAALGAGVALVLAMSLVVYRYYVQRRSGKEWAQLDDMARKSEHAIKLTAGVNGVNGPVGIAAAPSRPTSLYRQHRNFNILKERCQVQQQQPKRGPSSPPLSFLANSSQDALPQRRASTCSMHFPRLLSVDEGSGSPTRLNERRGSGILRCMSPIIRAISPEGSPSLVVSEGGGGVPVRSHDFRPPLTPSRSLNVDAAQPPFCSCSSSSSHSSHSSHCPEPRSPLRATSPDLRSTSPSPELRPLSPRSRPISPLFIPKQAVTFDCGATLSSGALSPIGTIQPDLYKKKDTILMDSQGGATGSAQLGKLHFRLKYDFQRSDLIVHVIEAHNLTSSENGGFNDPYVKVSLVPQVDTKSRETKIIRRSTDPYFNETFKFPVTLDDLAEKRLDLQVFDYDKYSRNDVVGDIQLRMREVDVTSDVEVWSEIRKIKKPPRASQELLFSLSYLPSAERLTVVILKAQNLICSSEDAPNPLVKLYLLQDGRRLKKKKTTIRRGALNPVWNEAVAFNVPSALMARTSLELKLFNNDALMGTCVVGASDAHWAEMLQNTRKSVAKWHAFQ